MKLPQLSWRDLFWLVALVAMGCGWWVDRQRASQKLDKVAKDRDRFERQYLVLINTSGPAVVLDTYWQRATPSSP